MGDRPLPEPTPDQGSGEAGYHAKLLQLTLMAQTNAETLEMFEEVGNQSLKQIRTSGGPLAGASVIALYGNMVVALNDALQENDALRAMLAQISSRVNPKGNR